MSDTVTTYKPPAGSLTHRILDLLCRNPDEEYSLHDLQLKFETTRGAVESALLKPRALGLVRQVGAAWCAGPAMQDWKAAQQPAALPQLRPSAAPARKPGGGKRPLLDPDAVPVRDDIPLPPPAASTARAC